MKIINYSRKEIILSEGTTTTDIGLVLSGSVQIIRQQLADYLNLDRSALSKELAKMKKEGLLEYDRNVFQILST